MIPAGLMSDELTDQIEETVGIKKRQKETKLSGEKVHIDLKIPKEQKKDWQEFCESHGLTLTKGIAVAFDVLRHYMEKGSLTLNSYGVMFK